MKVILLTNTDVNLSWKTGNLNLCSFDKVTLRVPLFVLLRILRSGVVVSVQSMYM